MNGRPELFTLGNMSRGPRYYSANSDHGQMFRVLTADSKKFCFNCGPGNHTTSECPRPQKP